MMHRHCNKIGEIHIKKKATGEIGLLCLMRSFSLAYHLDRLESTSTLTRKVNLDAIQAFNEIVDRVDEL